MNQPANIAPPATSHLFKVTHYRMDTRGITLETYTDKVSADTVTGIRALTTDERRGLPITDGTGTHVVPWLAKTVIQTTAGNMYVQHELGFLGSMDTIANPQEKLPEVAQLIIAVQHSNPDIVQLPVQESYKPAGVASELPPDGAPYTYHPKIQRESLLSRITPTQWSVGAGIVIAGGLASSAIAYENGRASFSRSTECTETPMSSQTALIVGRPSEGMQLTVDRQGRVFVSTQAFENAKQATLSIGEVTGDPIKGYSADISDAYRPDTRAALNVCLQKINLNLGD